MYHPSTLDSDEPVSRGHALRPAEYISPMTCGLDDPDDDDGDWGDDDAEDAQPVELRLPSPDPTHARPGSAEKIAILAARYDAGVDLWHDDDPTNIVGRVTAFEWCE